MKKHILCCFVLLVSQYVIAQFTGNVSKAARLPTYQTVVNTFFSTHDASRQWLQDLNYTGVNFEKRMEGWFVTFSGKTPETFLYWSKKDSAFQRISMPEPQGPVDQKVIAGYLTEKDILMFNTLPYFGYRGWYNDLIAHFRNYGQYEDTLLYAVATAHFAAADYMFHNLDGFKDTTDLNQPRSYPNTLNEEQLFTFRALKDTGKALLRHIESRNHEFSIGSKTITRLYADECLRSFLNLRIYQNEEVAFGELKEHLYDELTLSKAKEVLTSCDSGAILFTNGEQEAFPMLYLQETRGLRKGVLVVNTPLLLSRDYVQSLSYDNSYGIPMPLSFKRGEINALADYYVLDKNADNIPLDAVFLMKQLKQSEQKFRDVSIERNYSVLPARRYTFKGKEIEMQLNDILYLSDLLFLDLVSNPGNKRPIHLTESENAEVGNYYDKYLIKKGAIRKFNTEKQEGKNKQKKKLKPAKQAQK